MTRQQTQRQTLLASTPNLQTPNAIRAYGRVNDSSVVHPFSLSFDRYLKTGSKVLPLRVRKRFDEVPLEFEEQRRQRWAGMKDCGATKKRWRNPDGDNSNRVLLVETNYSKPTLSLWYVNATQRRASNPSLDCAVTLANDTGMLRGKVTGGDNPTTNVVVVLILESRELRRIPPYTLTSKTDAAGEYKISGVIPGNYFLFAVPPSPDNKHFALNFADHHRASAERIDMDASGVQAADLKLTSLE
jgi:hypothetical protein